MPVSLDQILESTRRQLPGLQERRAALERAAASAPLPPSFSGSLAGPNVAVIAEVKRRSPSAGPIREDLDPATLARTYADAGAAAISVLTDGPFFGGSLADLQCITGQVTVPVLRKDFILDELQVLEARASGAAAILLIVRALKAERLQALLAFSIAWQIEALVEVHTRPELTVALEAGARVVGVNSRDLDTFQIDTSRAWELLGGVPSEVRSVAESGMASRSDIEAAAEAGADAVLVGTALSGAADPARLLASFGRVPRRDR